MKYPPLAVIGGSPSCSRTRAFSPGPKLRNDLDAKNKLYSRCYLTNQTIGHNCRFRARRPKAATQDAKPPVKIRKNTGEKGRSTLGASFQLVLTAFLSGIFPYFPCARKLLFTLRYFARSNCIIRKSQHPHAARPKRRKMRSGAERSEQISAIL